MSTSAAFDGGGGDGNSGGGGERVHRVSCVDCGGLLTPTAVQRAESATWKTSAYPAVRRRRGSMPE